MQGPIAQALMLTCAGNAFLRGRDLSGFWPDALVFKFSKSCDFRVVDDKSDRLIAPDPLAWFETLRGAKGLRLHHAPRPREPGQTLFVEARKLAAFVGGGPAWLIEVVGAGPSVIWQGFERFGDRHDPERKVWFNTYLRMCETTPQDDAVSSLAQAAADLDKMLIAIEALARRMQFTPWPDVFASARQTLHADVPETHFFSADFSRYGAAHTEQQRLLGAILGASVFGGMGSWNDIVPEPAFKADYERLSELLFMTVNDAICALANSTYR
jgi:hypothetical protein